MSAARLIVRIIVWAIAITAGMALIVLASYVAVPTPAYPADEEPAVETAIVFLVDTSYSMDRYELRIARESHVAAFRSPDVQAALAGGRVAVAYVEFGGFARTIIDWTIVEDGGGALAFADALAAAPITGIAGTSIGAGLAEANRLLDRLPYGAGRVVVDVVGDGMNAAKFAPVGPPRNVLIERGAVINGMPLMLAPSEVGLDRYYEDVVIGGPGAFSMPLTAIEQMPAALRQKIVLEMF